MLETLNAFVGLVLGAAEGAAVGFRDVLLNSAKTSVLLKHLGYILTSRMAPWK